jgi:hypothetical protein
MPYWTLIPAALAIINFVVAMLAGAPHLAGILSGLLWLVSDLLVCGLTALYEWDQRLWHDLASTIGMFLAFAGISLWWLLYGTGLSMWWSLGIGLAFGVVAFFAAVSLPRSSDQVNTAVSH